MDFVELMSNDDIANLIKMNVEYKRNYHKVLVQLMSWKSKRYKICKPNRNQAIRMKALFYGFKCVERFG
eukprot:SAG22_NODE_15786_length_340_cov_9.510373_1_plen_69_part_00